MEGYRTPIIKLPGEPNRRLICRWPTLAEKMAHLDAETDARGGFGQKPGDAPTLKLSALYKASIDAVLPLIIGVEEGGSDIVIEDFDRTRLEDGRWAEPLFGLAQFLFRPASVVGDFGTPEDEGAV